MSTNNQEIQIGDRIFFYESHGSQESISGFGTVVDKTTSFISEKYGMLLGVAEQGGTEFEVLVVLHDGDGTVEEHLSKDCVKQESW